MITKRFFFHESNYQIGTYLINSRIVTVITVCRLANGLRVMTPVRSGFICLLVDGAPFVIYHNLKQLISVESEKTHLHIFSKK